MSGGKDKLILLNLVNFMWNPVFLWIFPKSIRVSTENILILCISLAQNGL